jgi:hypothetical protein
MQKKLNIIQEELKDLAIQLPIHPNMPFQIAETYFDEFSNNILESIRAEEVMANYSKGNPYEVPTGYFNQFEENILAEAGSFIHQSKLSRALPFTVPAHYFENLSRNLEEHVVNETRLDLYSREMVYEFPDNYFTHLPEMVMLKVHNANTTSAFRPILTGIRSKMSLAATILLFVAISFASFLQQTTGVSSSSSAEIALDSVSDEEMQVYLNNHQHEIDYMLATETASFEKAPTIETESPYNPLDFVSDEEIDAYNFL